jgi:hypothetical protein
MSPDELAPTRWPEARGPRGMVAAPHLLASQSGVAALRAGGNALDAAIAAAATIAVVYPHMNGIGGDNFWLIWDAKAGRLLRSVGPAARRPRPASTGTPRAGSATPFPRAADWPPSPCPARWMAGGRRTAIARPPWARRSAGTISSPTHRLRRGGFSASAGQRRPPPREPDLFGPSASAEIRRDLWPLYHPDALARGPLVQRNLARSLEMIRDGGPRASTEASWRVAWPPPPPPRAAR